MRVDSSTLLEGAYASWWARDLEAVLACFADDVVFVNHLPTDVVPFAGASYGKAELRQQLQIILDQFDFLEYRPVQIVAKRRLCHSQVHFRYRHKATGLTYEGRLRHIWRVEGDKIVRFEEYHDPERTRAFFELLALYDKQSQVVDRATGSRE